MSMLILAMILHLNMVAEVSGVPPTTPAQSGGLGSPGSSGTPSGTSTMSLGKIFGSCDKLNKDNYEIWIAGLISALTSLTALSIFYEQLEKTLRYLKTNAHMSLDAITSAVGSQILLLTRGATDRTSGDFKEFNKQLFHVFNTTINESLSNIKKTMAGSAYFEDGLKVIRYFYDELGPGDKTSRTGTTLALMQMKQGPDQSITEYGDCMRSENDKLVKPVPDFPT
jgi:hypothetical protein